MATAFSTRAGPASFEYTATGVLGDQRNTMLANKLHLRSELGKSKSHGHASAPGTSVTYGMPYPEKDSGVAGALIWTTPETKPTVDGGKKKKSKLNRSETDLTKAYGRPVRPSTPIHEVLSFKYQDDWIAQQRAAQLAKMKLASVKKLPPGAYRENHTSTLRAASKQIEVDEGPGWQMKKFTDHAHTNIDTFRSESARERAFKNQAQPVILH